MALQIELLNVSGDTTLPVVCWESCDDCSFGPSSYSVVFEIDMRNVTDTYTTPEVNGTLIIGVETAGKCQIVITIVFGSSQHLCSWRHFGV